MDVIDELMDVIGDFLKITRLKIIITLGISLLSFIALIWSFYSPDESETPPSFESPDIWSPVSTVLLAPAFVLSPLAFWMAWIPLVIFYHYLLACVIYHLKISASKRVRVNLS